VSCDCFAKKDILVGLSQAVAESIKMLDDDPVGSDDDRFPAGPHSAPDLVDRDKTPGTGALPEANAGEIDPGVG
jgi:hypothetical protein